MAGDAARADVLILGGRGHRRQRLRAVRRRRGGQGRQDHSRRQPRRLERGPHHPRQRPLRCARVRGHAHALGARALHSRVGAQPALPDPGSHDRRGRRRRLWLVAPSRDDGCPRRKAGAPGHRHERRAHGGLGAGAPAGHGYGGAPSNCRRDGGHEAPRAGGGGVWRVGAVVGPGVPSRKPRGHVGGHRAGLRGGLPRRHVPHPHAQRVGRPDRSRCRSHRDRGAIGGSGRADAPQGGPPAQLGQGGPSAGAESKRPGAGASGYTPTSTPSRTARCP